MRILLVSQMYPGPEDPDFGVFVRGLEQALAARGHELERAVVDRRSGGKRRWVELGRDARREARRLRPDVVYAHFLVPAGLLAALASRAPLVVTAHGQDVANAVSNGAIRRATRWVCRRASTVVAVSEYLRQELERVVPEARDKTEVVDCGVDLERFALAPAPDGPPSFLHVGTLTERKNVVRLADAFERLGDGDATLTFVGDGPLRGRLEGRPGVVLAGAVPHEEVAQRMAAARVACQPSLVEPFGQAVLEAMAVGRSVLATRVGGPAELVPAGAGVLVDPLDVESIARGLEAAAALPCPNPAARAAAEGHDVRRQAERIEKILARAAR
ncbi:MAG TPA: glycosyltransferase [Gaiellaceae bacterium]|nr:glycosyltransferase [Gaiellaceae bacterium]